jgi:subtilisin-like proprotein convertase family protein
MHQKNKNEQVQGIIAKTSKRVINDPLDESVVVNGAGYWHSRWYGFGVINALAAVEAALEWELYTEEEQVIGMSKEENAVLSDDLNSNDNIHTSTIKITKKDSAEDFLTESTVMLLDLKHYNRGDLEIILTSPSGTESLLHAGLGLPEDTQLEESERWKLMTVRNIGESPIGVWSLSVRDLVDRSNNPNIVDENIFRQWKLIVYGRSISTSASSSGDGDVDGSGNGPDDEGVGEDEESPEADKQSQFCLDQKNGGGSVFECGITSDGNNSCPAGTVLSFGDESRTVDANILCPLDITLGQNIDYITASQKGLCECDASLYDTNCDQITFDEELTCGCFVCPTGSTLVVSYSCNKPIIDNCLTFDCDGKCNGLYQPPLLEIITTNSPTTFPTTSPTKSPTNVPTNDPTKEPTKAPTVSPTKNSSKAPKMTEPPTVPPTKQDVIIVNPDPTNSPTKEIGITTTEDEESQVQQQKPPSGQPIEQPVMQPIAQPLGEQFGGDDEDVNDSNNNNTNTGDDGDEEQQQQDATIENVSCEKSFSIDSDTIMEGSITKLPTVVDVEGTCLSGLETVGGWYEMVGNGNIYTLSACSMDPSKSVGINVFTAGDNANDDDDKCSDLICIENQSRQVADCGSEEDDNNTNNNGYAISWVSESEKTYHVLVSGLPIGVGSSSVSRRLLEPNQDNYDYELQFSEEEIPLNTECKLSFPVPFKEPVEGRTVGDDSIATVYDTCKETKRSGVWYTFSDGKPNDGILVYQANTCSTETNFNNEISIFRGNDCDSLKCVNIDFMPCQKNGEYGEMAYWTTSIEETFHIFVHAAENNNNDNNIIDGGSNIATSGFDAGHFSMDISYAGRKGNDQCGAAISINIDQDELTGNTDGTKPDMASIIGSSCGIGGAGAWVSWCIFILDTII